MIDPLFFLYADNYRTYNIEVAKKLGSIHAAIFLGELCQRSKYHAENKEFVSDPRYGDNWFYYTGEKCEERTGMTVDEQRTAYKLLIRRGLIEQANFAVPCKKHFRIKVQEILIFFGLIPSNNVSSYGNFPNWLLENPKLDVAKSQTGHYIEEHYIEEHKEDNNGREAPMSSLRSDDTPPSPKIKKEEATEEGANLAEYFYLELSRTLGKIKKPNLSSWALQFDDFMRIDTRSSQEIIKAIDFVIESHSDSSIGFDWTISVQCPKKLREKFDKINAAMNPPKKSKTVNPKKEEQKNKQDTMEFIATHPREAAFLKADTFWVKIGNDSLYYDDPRFVELFNHYLQKQKR